MMLPKLQQGLEPHSALANSLPDPPTQRAATAAKNRPPDRPTPQSALTMVNQAMISSARKYSGIKDPILAIFAQPHACMPNCDNAGVKAFEAQFGSQVAAFEAGNPAASVVRLPNANHYVYQSNEAEVEQEMNRFMDGLSGH
jgi:hypothetical protein